MAFGLRSAVVGGNHGALISGRPSLATWGDGLALLAEVELARVTPHAQRMSVEGFG